MVQLSYSLPLRSARPGIVTAVGVLSIVIGSLGILGSFYSGLQALGLFMVSRLAIPTATTPPTATISSGGSVSISVVAFGGPATSPAATAPATVVPSPTLPATAPSSALTPAEAGQVIARVQAYLGATKLNAAQVATLTKELQNPSQQLVLPGTAWSPVSSASVQADGTAFINLTGGYIHIDAKGTVVGQFSSVNAMTGFSQKISIGSCLLVAGECVASLGLAVLLLVAGILTLRVSHRAPRLHWIYAWAKIPVAIFGGIAWARLMNQFMSSFAGATPMASSKIVFEVYAGVLTAIACAYPIALLFVLRTQSVRRYYHSIVG